MGRPTTPPGGTGAVNPRQVRDRLWIVRVRWRDDAGEYHRTIAEAPSKKQCADLVMARVDEERRALRDRLTSGLTLDEVAERWLTSLERTRRRPSTIASYRATYRATLAPLLGTRPVDALTRAEVQQVLLDGLFARHPGTRTPDGSWAPGAYRLDEQGHRIPLRGEQPRAVMKMVLRFAADRGYRADGTNPLDGTQAPERRAPSVRALTDEETERLLAMAEQWHLTGHGASDVLFHGCLVMAVTGLRVGELLALSFDDLDLASDPPTLTARHTLTEPRSGTAANVGPTKGGTVDVIALDDRAVEILRQRAARATPGAQYVFSTRTGRPVSTANFRRALRDLVRGTDLSWVHPHSFRATLATKANRQQGSIAARDLLRHADAATTRHFYIEDDGTRVLDPRSLFGAPTPANRTATYASTTPGTEYGGEG